ncbi:unnamed protein product [Chironomus riparius]|uniref:Uncharacterized protein n=1 Tax=Chironomus riparius TaxID=315576 RepID=A0A9N9WNR7_9DIPT|nr:unnamed protein product [Chironomus riparius]
MEGIFKNFLLAVLLLYLINESTACQGFKLKIHYMKNCGSNNVIKLQDNSTAKLTKDCEIVPTVCAETEGFKTAMLHYEIYKNNLIVLRGDIDACAELKKLKPEVKEMIKLFGLPDKCPIEKQTKCEDGSKKANVQQYKSFLQLALGGPIRTEITIQHDTGKSCFKSEVEFVKK